MTIDFAPMTGDIIDAFGLAVTYTPLSGSPVTINGIFDNGAEVMDDGTLRGVVRSRPSIEVKTSDASTAAEGAALTILGTSYLVVAALPDDGGLTVLQLRRAT